MTTAMLLLAAFGVATPLVIIGDRLSVFIPPGPFLSLMGKIGGYNHLKQLGVGSTIAGQLLVGAIGGGIFGLFARAQCRPRPGDLDDIDFDCAADRSIRDCALAGTGDKLHRAADCGGATGHARLASHCASFSSNEPSSLVSDF